MKTFLITGATGYIGNHLLKYLLRQKHQVFVLVRKNSDLSRLPQSAHNLQLCYYDSEYQSIEKIFMMSKIDTVFHLAAQGNYYDYGPAIHEIIAANITLGTQLLQAMSTFGCAYFINTGTYWQHYQHAERHNPVCLYAASKQAFEEIIDYYVAAKKIRALTLKLLDVYGPHDQRKKLFRVLFEAAQTKNALAMSPGEQIISLTYIDDVVEAYIQGLNYIMSGEYNDHAKFFVANLDLKPLKEIVLMFEKILNKSVPIEWGKNRYREREIMKPIIGTILPGWQSRTSLEDGMTKMILLNE